MLGQTEKDNQLQNLLVLTEQRLPKQQGTIRLTQITRSHNRIKFEFQPVFWVDAPGCRRSESEIYLQNLSPYAKLGCL